jgi:DNA-binding NtrC family response regulator
VEGCAPKVLVVDDQQPVCTALELLLEVSGIPCAVARGPEEALAALSRGRIAAVLQDMNFRRGDTSGEEGLQLLTRIRSLWPEVPVVVMTAFSSPELAARLAQAGAAGFVPKPWKDAELVEILKGKLAVGS